MRSEIDVNASSLRGFPVWIERLLAHGGYPLLFVCAGLMDLRRIRNHQLSWWFDREPLKAVLKDSAIVLDSLSDRHEFQMVNGYFRRKELL